MRLTFMIASYAAFAALLLGFSGEAVHLAHNTVLLADAHEVRTALEVYNNEHGEYPATISALIPQYLSKPTNDDLNNVRYAQVAGGASYSLKVGDQ